MNKYISNISNIHSDYIFNKENILLYPKLSMTNMTISCILYGTVGLSLGIMNNKLVHKTAKKMGCKKNKYMKAFIQFIYCAIILSFIHIHLSEDFAQAWPAGIFFISFFFGTQFSMYDTLTTVTLIFRDRDDDSEPGKDLIIPEIVPKKQEKIKEHETYGMLLMK
jgi:hypothetical protein